MLIPQIAHTINSSPFIRLHLVAPGPNHPCISPLVRASMPPYQTGASMIDQIFVDNTIGTTCKIAHLLQNVSTKLPSCLRNSARVLGVSTIVYEIVYVKNRRSRAVEHFGLGVAGEYRRHLYPPSRKYISKAARLHRPRLDQSRVTPYGGLP